MNQTDSLVVVPKKILFPSHKPSPVHAACADTILTEQLQIMMLYNLNEYFSMSYVQNFN